MPEYASETDKQGEAMIDKVQDLGEEILHRYHNGDDRAFTELFALYQEGLYSYLLNIVNDKHEAENIMIETFARLAVFGDKFAGRSSLKTYLYTIGKNLAIRYIKMRDRNRHISFEEAIWALADDGDSPEDVLEREESIQKLRYAVSLLNDDYKTVLELLYFEDMSYRQAAKVMSKSEKQINNLAYRAKLTLKSKLEALR